MTLIQSPFCSKFIFARIGVMMALVAMVFAMPEAKAQGTVRVNFPNSPVAAVLPYYENLTGKRIIQDANLTGANLTVASAEAMTRAEAIAFIDSIFLLNGYAFIPVDAETLKLVNVTGGKNPRSQGLPVISRAANLPEGDAVVNYVMTLQNISPEDAVRTFSQVVTLNSYGAITPLENASGVIITENTAVIRSLIELQSHVDVPPAQIANEFIKLHRADAEKIAEIISSLYEARTGVAPINGVAGGAAPNPAMPTAAGAAAGGPGDVFIIPYRRTNSILVMARPVDVRYVQSLVEQFDKPSDGVNFLKRTLNHVSVSEYLPAFYNALARGTDIEKADNLLDPSNVTIGGGQAQGIQNSGFSAAGGGGVGGSQITAPDRLSEPTERGTPQSYVVGNTLLIADPQANSLIVSGSPEHLEIVEKLIDEIDIQPRQVYISTVIGQLNLGDEFNYALNALQTLETFKTSDDLSIAGAGSFITGGAAGATNPITDIAGLTSASAFNGATGGLSIYGKLLFGSDEGSVNAMVNLFTRDTRFRILSRPSIYAQNNVKATISSGQRIAVPISTLTSTGGNGLGNNFPGSIASNIEYRDVVLKLEVIPLINSDDQVTLKIAQLNDNITGSQNISGNEIPTLSTQELITTVSVNNGSTIVLGGLITEREEEEVTGLPVIRRIPILGRLLGSTDKHTRREELLIFIQPHIIPTGQTDPNGPLPRDTVDLEMNRSELVGETMDFANPQIFQEPDPATVGQLSPTAAPPQAESDTTTRRFRLFNKSKRGGR